MNNPSLIKLIAGQLLLLNICFGLTVSAQHVNPDPIDEQQLRVTIQKRTEEALQYIQDDPWPSPQNNSNFKQYMALLLLFKNEQEYEANQMVIDFCGQNPLTEYVGQMIPRVRCEGLFRIYLLERTRRLLNINARTAIEDYAWNLLAKYSRDITRADADKSYWDYSGSENHFLNDRRRYTLALQIVGMSEKYGPETALEGETVSSNYIAWVKFWLRYFRDRAGEGVDMEVAHPSSYGQCTVGVYYDIYDLTDSEELRTLAEDFLTLYWAEVASEFEPKTGQRAGWAAMRNPHYSGERIYWAHTLLYTYFWHDISGDNRFLGNVPFLTSSYSPPVILTAIARNSSRVSYLTVSRRAGLQAKELDKRVIFDEDKNSHLRRDVFYTPDYALSTMTYHPNKNYDQHITLAQTMGATFSSDIHDRITVMGSGYYARRAISGITGEGVSIIARDPKASYGRGRFLSSGTRVFIKKGVLWDNRHEDESGWFFTQSGNAYAAIRIPGGYTVTDQTFTWPGRQLQVVKSSQGYYLECEDMWAPIVLQMGRAEQYEDFQAFQESVKSNKFSAKNGKLTYTSENGDTYHYWARGEKLARLNGNEVDLNPPKTYDSPFLSMVHGQSLAVISYPGYADVVLDFGK